MIKYEICLRSSICTLLNIEITIPVVMRMFLFSYVEYEAYGCQQVEISDILCSTKPKWGCFLDIALLV